ncbi:RNA polymerase sigma factor [Solicola sp. PLA-1-18]|uniref:RNA polymerase sigma factor n=1 Tax=Solicola sp. PLA-1-18 TaxID=3380532 RepID=UPI003B7D7B2B
MTEHAAHEHPKPSDAVLVRRATMGDREAFGLIFERYSGAAYLYALRMLDGHEHDARDVCQDSWIKVWQHLDTFRGESQLLTWILAIVSHQALDNRRRRRPEPVDNWIIDAEVASTSYQDDQMADLELWQKLNVALSELPWRQKAVWLLREIEGLSYEEMAHILDTNTTVVRGQLHRARRTVSARMEQWR